MIILDYKTGTAPEKAQIEWGFSPQMPLEALLAEKGAFKDLPAATVGGMEYWLIKGGRNPIEIKRVNLDPEKVIMDAEDGLHQLVAAFVVGDSPFLSRPRPEFAKYKDYDHLARVAEWELSLPDRSISSHGSKEMGADD